VEDGDRLVDVAAVTIAVEAVDLYRFYHAGDEETLALRGVSLRVEVGEIVAVMGPSGSGKSTLLTCLAGLDEPDGGVVRILGKPITRRPEEERALTRARSIGVLFQSGNLLEHLTLTQNVTVAQRLAKHERRRTVDELLDSVALSHRARARPSELSGGETARAGLAVALANDPVVLFADEPTGELDSASAERILELIAEHARRGTAVVVVTHNRTVAEAADRIVALVDGRVADGPLGDSRVGE
jgi:putative ABC transport system ATP-binding protein